MYNGIGLSTVRGSATSGYVQRNLSFVGSKQSRKDTHRKEESNLRSTKDSMFGKSQPNQGILDHERKRKIEVKCLEMEELLREQGVEDNEITLKVDTYRSMLNDKEKSKRMEDGDESLETDEFGRAVYKDSHQFAKAQKAKNDKLKRAFAISDSYEDGSGFDRREEKIKKAALDVVDILIHSDSVDGDDMANAKSASKHHTKKSTKKKSKLKKKKNRHHASKKKSRRRHRFSSTDDSSDSTSSDSSSDSDGGSSSLERKRREKRRRRVSLDRHDRDRDMRRRDTRPSPDYSQKGPSSMRRRSSPSHSPHRRDRRDDYNRRGRSRSREDRRRHLGGHNRNGSPSRSDHHYRQEAGGARPSPSKRNGSSLHRVSYREPRFVEQNACNHVVNEFGGVDGRPPVVPVVMNEGGRDEAAVATEKRRSMRKLRRDAREKRGGDRSPRSSGELSTSSASSEDEMVNGHEVEKNAVQHRIAESKDVSGKAENSIKSDAKLSNLESNVGHKSTKEKGEESGPSSSTNTTSRRVDLSGEMRTRADSKKSPLQFPKVSRSNVDRIARRHDSHSSASDDEEQSHEKLVSTSSIRIRSPETKVTTHKIDESDELQKASNRKSSVKHGDATLSSNSTKGKNQSISNVAVEELDSKLIVLKKQTDLESDKQELKRLRKERIKAEILELQKKVSLKEKEDTLKSKDKENGHGDANKRRGDPVAIKNGTDTTKHKKRNGKIDSPKKVKATTNKQKGKKNNNSASSSSSSEGDDTDSSSSADSTGSSEDRSGDSSSSGDEKFDHEKRKRPSDDKPINNSKKTMTKNGNSNVHDNKKQQKNDADDDDKLMLTVQKLMKKDNRQPMKSPPPSKFAKGTLKNNRSSTTAVVKVEKKKTATENKKDESGTINDDRIDFTNKKPVSKSSSAVRKGKLDVVTKEITANKRMPSKRSRSSSSSSRSSSSSSSRSSSSSDSSNRRSSGSSRSSEDNDSSGGRGSSDTSASSDSDSESERRGRRRGGKSAK